MSLTINLVYLASFKEMSDLKEDIQGRIVNIELVIRSDSSSSESEDEGGSL